MLNDSVTSPVPNGMAVAGTIDNVIADLLAAVTLLERAKRLAQPVTLPATVDGHRIGARS
jgi:hypothetical protein